MPRIKIPVVDDDDEEQESSALLGSQATTASSTKERSLKEADDDDDDDVLLGSGGDTPSTTATTTTTIAASSKSKKTTKPDNDDDDDDMLLGLNDDRSTGRNTTTGRRPSPTPSDESLLQVQDAEAVTVDRNSRMASPPTSPPRLQSIQDPFFTELDGRNATPERHNNRIQQQQATTTAQSATTAPPSQAQPSVMPMAQEDEERRDDRPLTFAGGSLPADFLRLTVPVVVEQPAHGAMGYVSIVVHEARLTKNYGFVKMDPSVHIKIQVLRARTNVCTSGGTEPVWNQTLMFPNVSSAERIAKLEVHDIGMLSDKLVATADIPLAGAMNGGIIDQWFDLDGKQGVGKEGVIHLTIQFRTGGPHGPHNPHPYSQPYLPSNQYPQQGFPEQYQGYPQQQPHQPQQQTPQQQQPEQRQQQPQPQQLDISQLKDMFPDMDEAIMQDVLASKQGNVEEAINALLMMSVSD